MPPTRRLGTMKKPKSILVVFNGSESGDTILKQALKLANKGDCEVAVAIVLPSHKGKPVLVGVKSVKEAARRPEAKIMPDGACQADETSTQIQTILERANIHKAIVNAAIERDCDLIIIGRRDRESLARSEKAFMESVTARVIGHSPIDVLVMPSGAVLKWDNILLAIDKSKCSEVAAERALDIARHHKGELKVVSVVGVPDEAYAEAPNEVEKLINRARDIVESVKDRATRLNIKTEVFVREGEPHEKIISIASNIKADIICMGSYGRRGLSRLLVGSVTEKVIEKSSCPVLVVKP